MLLNDEVKSQLKKIFSELVKPVILKVFTQSFECHTCEDNRSLAEEIASVSDKISVEVHNFETDKTVAEQYNIDKIPAIAVVGEKDYGIRFYGVPAGYEFTSIIEAIKLVSTGKVSLSDAVKKEITGITKKVHLQVCVTPTCPYCPRAVVLAHQMAYLSENITADMVEVSEFPHIAVKYEVQGVPRTIINESTFLEGAAPDTMLMEKIRTAVK